MKSRRSDVVIDTTKVRLFKQITTLWENHRHNIRCYWYHKGKTFQANHNCAINLIESVTVVIDTTKVRLFKQITTNNPCVSCCKCCYWYHKGKTFQANHNYDGDLKINNEVVIDTTKVRLFKQITTRARVTTFPVMLLLIPQR